MRHAGINADHHIHQLTQRRRVCKVFELITKVLDTRLPQRLLVYISYLLLQAHVLKAIGQISDQLIQCEASVLVVLVRGTSAPHQTNAWLGFEAKFRLPLLDLGFIATQVSLR